MTRLLLAIVIMAAVAEACAPHRKPQLPAAPVEPKPEPGPLLAGVDTGSVRADLTPEGEAFWFGAQRAYPERSRGWAWSLCGDGIVRSLEAGRAAA